MKKIIYTTVIFLALILFMTYISTKYGTKDLNKNEKIKVVTTLFPNYDFAKHIGKEKVEVSLLLPPGIEPHSYEPSPKDIVKISSSDIFIYTGKDMEPWVDKLINSMGNDLKIVDLSSGIDMADGEEEEHEDGIEEENEHEHEGQHHHGRDPHIWTDPNLAIIMSENIMKAFSEYDIENRDFYIKNYKEYKGELEKLDERIADALKKTKLKTVVSTGHFAFHYFFERYGLNFVSPYHGFSPNAEPSAKDIAKLREEIEKTGVKYIYHEEILNPKTAKILAEDIGIGTLELNGAHNISKKDMENQITYIDIMEKNLENLKLGLEYEE